MKASKVILLILALYSFQYAAGQAYVNLANGESLTGNLTVLNCSFIRISAGQSGRSQKFTADQIEYVRNGRWDYYSKKIASVNTAGPATVDQLVRLTAWGKINVFRHVNRLRPNSYSYDHYIQKGDSGLVYIGSRQGLVMNKKYRFSMLGQIAAQVSTLFSDNPELQHRFNADERNWNRKVIVRYVKEYNQRFKETLKSSP